MRKGMWKGMLQGGIDHTAGPAAQNEKVGGMRVDQKGQMDKGLDQRHIRNWRDDGRAAVLKENELALVFENADVAVRGVLVMDDLLVLPLRLDGVAMQPSRLAGQPGPTHDHDQPAQKA